MRYRPFGRSGLSTSAVALCLTDDAARRGADHVRALIFAGLEAGVNAYHIGGVEPVIAQTLGQALSVVDRSLVCVTLQAGVTRGRMGLSRDFSAKALSLAIDRTIEAGSLGYLDAVVLDDPDADELPRPSLDALKALRATGRVNMLGVAGQNEAMDAYISTNAFDLLITPHNLRSGWKERNRLKQAIAMDMGVIAYGFFPPELATPKKADAFAGRRRGLLAAITRPAEEHPLAGMGTYAFLHQTSNWTAEEICLSFVLTEPSLSSVLVDTVDPAHLTALAAVPDRDMPPGLAAQVEMARFGPTAKARAG